MGEFEVFGGETSGLGAIFNFDDIAGFGVEGRDIDLATIDLDVAVGNELASTASGVGEAEAEDHVIESGFEELEENFPGDAAFIGGDVKVATELAFEDTILVAKLLFFAEGDGVFALLAAGALWSVHAGAVIFPFEGFGRAEEGDAEAAADF